MLNYAQNRVQKVEHMGPRIVQQSGNYFYRLPYHYKTFNLASKWLVSYGSCNIK
jgi:hypothetical protein